MAEPFLGQIEFFAFAQTPKGWLPCAGQLLSISQNQALFSLLGTNFGGDGRTTFGLPDLRGATAMGQGNGSRHMVGEKLGSPDVTLTADQIPPHRHPVGVVYKPDIANNVFTPDSTVALAKTTGTDADGKTIPFNIYVSDDSAPQAVMASDMVGGTGGTPHLNMMPYLTGSFCIAINGVYPSRP